MALNFGTRLFGKERVFSGRGTQQMFVTMPRGVTANGTLDIITRLLKSALVIFGFEVSIMVFNMAAAKTITITLTNETQATTLLTRAGVTLNQGQATIRSYFYSEEQINMGDTIRLTITGDGVGTAAGAEVHGHINLIVSTVFEQQDEKEGT